MALEWRLRKVMAEKNIWTGSELARLMKEKAGHSLSAPSISALLNDSPKHVKTETMDALCTALECTPSDLWKHTPTFTKSTDAYTGLSGRLFRRHPDTKPELSGHFVE